MARPRPTPPEGSSQNMAREDTRLKSSAQVHTGHGGDGMKRGDKGERLDKNEQRCNLSGVINSLLLHYSAVDRNTNTTRPSPRHSRSQLVRTLADATWRDLLPSFSCSSVQELAPLVVPRPRLQDARGFFLF